MSERILFVTGRLAEHALRRVLGPLGSQLGFEYDVRVLPISVAALMHADWIRGKLEVPQGFDRVVLPGWCQGELSGLTAAFGVPMELGPKDLLALPQHFGRDVPPAVDLEGYDIEILAEINHAPRLSDEEILKLAGHYRDSGADVIDVGTVPGERWTRTGEVTRQLRDRGFRVSIDSFDRHEVEDAVSAGAELVLSCNSSNIGWAADLPAELVVIPDETSQLADMDRILHQLAERKARFRIDPVLEPIGFGFTASLGRYLEARRRWPDVEMMMGVGNLTELTEVDSAGANMLLAGICQELSIRSVLSTEVINWASSAIRELDLARRIARYSVQHQVLPKHVDSSLLLLRDPHVMQYQADELKRLASQLTDPNFRIFVAGGLIHVMNRDGHWQAEDPYELIDDILATGPLDPSHAFYLGYELSKAVTARTLGKQYTQDEPLRWGFLTTPETSAVERRRHRRATDRDAARGKTR